MTGTIQNSDDSVSTHHFRAISVESEHRAEADVHLDKLASAQAVVTCVWGAGVVGDSANWTMSRKKSPLSTLRSQLLIQEMPIAFATLSISIALQQSGDTPQQRRILCPSCDDQN